MDMPLEQLKSYEGKTPRPGDFDEYWERAMEEMRAVDPQLCITRADFQAPTVDCYEMYFTGVNGARILPTRAYEGITYYFRKFDPRHEREDEVFTKLGYIDVQNLAPRIKAEVIMFTGLCDNACPPSTQYAVYNKMTCKKQHILYPDYGHEYLKDADEIVFRFLTDFPSRRP